MCLTTKESVSALLIIVVISVLLFMRDNTYDRLIAILFLVISLIQLTEFLFHEGCISPDTGGRLIYIILWLQVAVLGVGLEVTFHTNFTTCWAAIFVVIFVAAVYTSLNRTFEVTREYGHLVWTKENEDGNILGPSAILYFIGLFVPFLIIEYYNDWNNMPIWIILAALTASFVLVRMAYPRLVFSSLWCYSSVGVLFVAWLVGAFQEHSQ